MKAKKCIKIIIMFLFLILCRAIRVEASELDFNVTIPKTIILGSNRQSEYDVKVEGNIDSNTVIVVRPVVNQFLMEDQSEENKKADVMASINSSKIEWSSEDALNGAISRGNKITAQGLSAGTWEGTFAFEIFLVKEMTLSTDGDVIIGVGSQLQTNAYLNDEVATELVSYESDNANVSVENGMVSVSKEAVDGEEATITVTYVDEKTGKTYTVSFKVTIYASKYGSTLEASGYCGGDSTCEAVQFNYWGTNTSYGGNKKFEETCYTNAQWEYYSDTKTLVISGTGPMLNKTIRMVTDGSLSKVGNDMTMAGYNNLLHEVEHVVIEDGITNVPAYAFSHFTELQDVDFGETVNTIEQHAFSYDTALTEVYLPDSVETIKGSPFHLCSGITSFRIGKGLKYSESLGTMRNCEIFYYDAIDAEFKSEKNGVLWCLGTDAESGVELIIGADVEVIPDNFSYQDSSSTANRTPNFSGDIIIPKNVTKIGDYAFQYSPNLKTVKFEEGIELETIGKNAFYRCTGLTDIEIPDSVTSVGSLAFNGCTGLTEITMPVNIVFEKNTFTNCTNIVRVCLTKGSGVMPNYERTSSSATYYQNTPWYISRNKMQEVQIEDGVINIGTSAFYNCTGLVNIEIPDSVTSIGQYAFYGCTGLNDLILPSNLTSIENYTFNNCTGLTEIEIPDSVTSIGQYAFYGCTGLNDLILSKNLASIESYAFYNCIGLINIEVPDSVISIGSLAFGSCKGLASIYLPASVNQIIAASYSKSPFYQCNATAKIYCGASGKQSGWGTYWNYYASGKMLSTTFGMTRDEYQSLFTSTSSLLSMTDISEESIADDYAIYENMDEITIFATDPQTEDVSESQE